MKSPGISVIIFKRVLHRPFWGLIFACMGERDCQLLADGDGWAAILLIAGRCGERRLLGMSRKTRASDCWKRSSATVKRLDCETLKVSASSMWIEV